MTKSFKGTPTTDFISVSEEVENTPNVTIERLKEVQSKRVQLTIKPSLYAKLKEYADENCVSVNGAVTRAIVEMLKGDR